MPRHIAPITALILFAAMPFSASAEARAPQENRFCRMAEKDPVAFVQRKDFARRLVQMSDDCPDLAAAFSDFATGSIPGNKTGIKEREKDTPNYSLLIAKLKSAKAEIETATRDVDSARKKLDATIRRAKSAGLSEGDLEALYPILDGDSHDILPDFTAAKRKALDNYVAARNRLSDAEENLAEANKRAEPLVRSALELAGKADAAQGDLNEALGDMTAEDRKALLDSAVDAANKALADLQDRLAKNRTDLQAAIDRLNSLYLSDRYQSAHIATTTAYDAMTKAEADLEKAKQKQAAAQAAVNSLPGNCQSPSCHSTRSALEDAKDSTRSAKNSLERKTSEYETAWAELKQIMDAEHTWEQQLNIAALTDAVLADEAAEAAAKRAAEDAARDAKALADLIEATAKALADAADASEAARAATATEEAEVTAAKAALEAALAAAKDALAGSEEEVAALADVESAKDDLLAALAKLGAAQDVVADLGAQVDSLTNPPQAVSEAADDLNEADEAGDATAGEAAESIADADEAVADYNDAQQDLSDALDEGESAETSPDSAPETTPDT